MTLLGDISQVHDGVLKAPPLNRYGGATTISDAQNYAHSADKTNPNHEHVYNDAKTLAVEAVRIMQLASKNIEKERHEIRQEVEDENVLNVRELVDKYDECTSCHKFKTCEIFPKAKHCMEYDKIESPQNELDYVFEVGLVLGTVRQK